VQKVFELSPIRQIASVQPISGDRLEGIEVLGEAGSGWVGETTTRSETTTPTLGKYEIVAQEQYAAPRATQKLLDDGSIDVEGWLNGQVVGKFARLEGAAFINGTGVSQPRGFATNPTAVTSDLTRAWGTMEIIKTGVSSDFAAADKADVLFDIIGAFKPAYTVRANWVTNRAVMAKIRKMKQTSTNDYLWQPGLTLGQPSQLLSYPITMAQDMPALAAGSLSLALGDFSEGYQIVDRLGIRTLRDPYTAKPYVIFYTIKRVGGAVINFEAIKFVYFGT
jgi:HK97 family phage major capsid protein